MNNESLSADADFTPGTAKETVTQPAIRAAHGQAPASIPNGDAGRSAGVPRRMTVQELFPYHDLNAPVSDTGLYRRYNPNETLSQLEPCEAV